MSNPDRAVLDAFAAGDAAPAPFDSNPFARLLDARVLVFDRAAGRLEMDFRPGTDFLQGNGVIQGGVVSAMMDFGLGLCVYTRLPPGRNIATVSLTVSFLRPALPGLMRVEATLDRVGRSAAFSHGSLQDGEGRVVATGVSVLSIVSEPQAGVA